MSFSIERVWPAQALLGECPIWSSEEQALFWLDIKGFSLHRLGPVDRRTWRIPGMMGCIALHKDGGLVGALNHALVRLGLDQMCEELTVEQLATLPETVANIRFNDGKVSPDGAFWVGTMHKEEAEDVGSWWRFDRTAGVSELDTGYRVTNGPAFDADRQRGFVTESARRTIFALDGWTLDACKKKRVLRVFNESDGYPDGMTIDAEGRLWVAFWNGACIRALDPVSGRTLEQIDLPIRRPTSCTFGGDGLDVLYVTSAAIGLDDPAAPDGSLFAVQIKGAKGVPAQNFG